MLNYSVYTIFTYEQMGKTFYENLLGDNNKHLCLEITG